MGLSNPTDTVRLMLTASVAALEIEALTEISTVEELAEKLRQSLPKRRDQYLPADRVNVQLIYGLESAIIAARLRVEDLAKDALRDCDRHDLDGWVISAPSEGHIEAALASLKIGAIP